MDPAPQIEGEVVDEGPQEERGEFTLGVAAVVLRGDSILLVKRRFGRFQGSWCIPCGHIGRGEDPRDAAAREVHEESGLIVEVGEVIDVLVTTHSSERRTIGIWFKGTEVGGQLAAGDDASEAKFFPVSEIPQLAFEADRLIIRKVLI